MNISSTSLPWPKPEYCQLENGTHCVFTQMVEASLICIDFWCKAGSFFEQPGEEGLAHFLEHMVFKGSRNLRAGEFDHKIEALGGSSNAATGLDDVHFHVLIPPQSVLEALELLLSLVFEPSLLPDAFETEREVVLEEIAQYKDQPDEQIYETLLKNCWSQHPYGRQILGIEESLMAKTPKDMDFFHKRRYIPKNCCLSIAGPISLTLKDIIKKSLSYRKIDRINNYSIKNNNKSLIFHKGSQEIYINRLESSRIIMAWPLPPANQQQLIMGIDLATTILSEGRRSKLVHRLREDLQIVESIDMDITILEQGGLIILEASCNKKNINIVRREIIDIINQIIDKGATEDEVNRAKQLVRNELIFSLETSSQLANIAGNKSLWNRKQPLQEQIEYITYWEKSRLNKDIFKFMRPELCNTLIASPYENS